MRIARLTVSAQPVALAAALMCVTSAASAQRNTIATDRARLREITGDTTASSPSAGPSWMPSWLRIVQPDVRVVWNSDIPFSLNDGPLWAGRGRSTSISAGVESSLRFRGALFRARFAPTFVSSANRPFLIIPANVVGRSNYSSPFHGPGSSLDLPLRFGDVPFHRFDPGRSELSASWRGVTARLTAENDWWGPGIRNAIVMSDNAAGIPRLEVATARPLRTPAGALSVKVIAGTLTPSLFFENFRSARRAISGATISLRPRFDTSLTLGLARVVYSAQKGRLGPLPRIADFAIRWESLRHPSDTADNGELHDYSDQITALNARWVFPSYGFEVYGEWARADLPSSVKELLTFPNYSGAFTFGFQWAQPRRGNSFLRLQSEITYLEQSRTLNNRSFTEYYSGHANYEGYTQRGQVIGAAIGPGASSQWAAIDHIAPQWQLGLFVGRIRWENDALYRQFVPNFFRHDVSLLGGIRGAYRTPISDIAVDVTWAHRWNFLFQNGFANPGFYRTVDVHQVTVGLSATPR